MHQKKLHLSVLGLILLANLNCAAGVSDIYKDQKWDFLEYKFVHKNNQEINERSLFLFFTSILPASVLAGKTADELIPKVILPDRDSKNYWKELWKLRAREEKISSISFVTLLAYPLVGLYSLYQYKLYMQCKRFRKFMAKWPKYKEYTPEELHNSLDALYLAYQDNTSNIPRRKVFKFMEAITKKINKQKPSPCPTTNQQQRKHNG